MELDDLRAFHAIAREGSFTRAGTALFLSQPAITARIRHLEEEVGRPLFDRTPRGAVTTEAGQALLPLAERILQLAEEAAAVGSRGGAAHLSLAAAVTLSVSFLPQALAAFLREMEDLHVTLRGAHGSEVLDMVGDGTAAVGFVVSDIPHPGLRRELVSRAPIRLFAPPDLFRGRRRLRVRDLRGVPLVLAPWGTGYAQFREVLSATLGDDLRIVAQVDPGTAAVELVAAGIGAAFLPSHVGARALAAGRLRTLPVEGLGRVVQPIYALLPRRRAVGAPAARFLQFLREAGRRPGNQF